MQETERQSKWLYVRWFVLRFALVIYDLVAINLAFILTLLVRFYVGKEFHAVATQYIDAYFAYAPYYSAFCILVFILFKLYSSMWKFAGVNDVNRILAANAICFLGHIVGTLIFVRRMPITFYCIGALLQFTLTTVIRLAPRFILVEKQQIGRDKRNATIRAMIVGAGSTGHTVIRQLQREGTVRPVCVLNYKDAGYAALLNGIPVVNGMDNLKDSLEKYKIGLVIIASTVMNQKMRNEIKAICEEEKIDVQDYSGFFSGNIGEVTLGAIADYCDGEVEIVVDGKKRKYSDAEQAVLNEAGRFVVSKIQANDNKIVIHLKKPETVLNDVTADWVKNQEQETGESVSFF